MYGCVCMCVYVCAYAYAQVCLKLTEFLFTKPLSMSDQILQYLQLYLFSTPESF